MNAHHPILERRFRALVVLARRRIDVGDTAEARVLLKHAEDLSALVWGDEDIHLVEVSWLMAASFARERVPSDSTAESELTCLRTALRVARRNLPADHLEIARLSGRLGSALVMRGLNDEGCALLLEAFEIAKKNLSEKNFLHYISIAAQAQLERIGPEVALSTLETAALAYERWNSDSLSHALVRFRLGKCLLALGRGDQAVDQLQFALRIIADERGRRAQHRLIHDIRALIDSIG